VQRLDAAADPEHRCPMPTPMSDQDERAQAPIRWPRPDSTTITAIVIWLVGLVVALLVPAAIVPPGSETAEPGRIWTAFAVSVVGAAITLGATAFHARRKGDSAVLILGLVPAFSAVVGGVIFATTMLSRRY
jgi:hypothetical protein